MTSVNDLRIFATQASRDARDYRYEASQCSGERRARLLRYAAQREEHAGYYRDKADCDERWLAQDSEHLEAAE